VGVLIAPDVKEKASDILVRLDNENVLCVDCQLVSVTHKHGVIYCKPKPHANTGLRKIEKLPTRVEGCDRFKNHWDGKTIVARFIRNMSLNRDEHTRWEISDQHDKKMQRVVDNPKAYRCPLLREIYIEGVRI